MAVGREWPGAAAGRRARTGAQTVRRPAPGREGAGSLAWPKGPAGRRRAVALHAPELRPRHERSPRDGYRPRDAHGGLPAPGAIIEMSSVGRGPTPCASGLDRRSGDDHRDVLGLRAARRRRHASRAGAPRARSLGTGAAGAAEGGRERVGHDARDVVGLERPHRTPRDRRLRRRSCGTGRRRTGGGRIEADVDVGCWWWCREWSAVTAVN